MKIPIYDIAGMANRGNAVSQLILALLYQEGLTTDADSELAEIYYQESFKELPIAGYYYARYLFSLDNRDIDAISIAKKAFEQGASDAALLVARAHELGKGVPKDLDKANKWIEIAAKNGNAAAYLELALQHINQQGKIENINKAKPLLEKAVELGEIGAHGWLAKILLEHENTHQAKRAFKLLEQGEKKMDFGCLMTLVSIVKYGLYGQKIDTKRANELDSKIRKCIKKL